MSRNLGNRRRGGGAWLQWLVIGLIMGFGCAVIVALAGLATGVLSVQGQGIAMLPTWTPFIITATPPPATATLPPSATPTATQTQPLSVALPTASPTINATLLTPQRTATPTTGAALPLGQPTTGGQSLATGGSTPVSDRLLALASELLPVPGGSFQMGTSADEVRLAVDECLAGYGGNPGNCQISYGEDSAPIHTVTLDAFSIEETEVSYEQYLTFLNGLGPGSHRNGCLGFPCIETLSESETSYVTFDSASYSVNLAVLTLPVANVTWYGAQAYCQALGRRLPTEAEWERAARGDDGRIFPWPGGWDATRASTNRPAEGGSQAKVSIDSFPTGASPYGALNMAGNVAEWVSDWYDPTYYGTQSASGLNPPGPATGSQKVVRGGSWDAVPFFARSVHRQSEDPLQPQAWIGFRCVQDQNAAPAATGPLGANIGVTGGTPVPGTPDPATLGIIPGASDEETTANAQPTLPPAPTLPPTSTLPPTPAGTLDPGA